MKKTRAHITDIETGEMTSVDNYFSTNTTLKEDLILIKGVVSSYKLGERLLSRVRGEDKK